MTAWTPAMDATLRECLEGGATASQAASVVSAAHDVLITRNSIISRVHRVDGLKFNSGIKGGRLPPPVKPCAPSLPVTLRPIVPAAKERQGPRRGVKHKIFPDAAESSKAPLLGRPGGEEAEASPPPDSAVLFIELRAHHCRYPIGGAMERAKFFCGKPKQSPHSYCAAHLAVCWGRAGTPWPADDPRRAIFHPLANASKRLAFEAAE